MIKGEREKRREERRRKIEMRDVCVGKGVWMESLCSQPASHHSTAYLLSNLINVLFLDVLLHIHVRLISPLLFSFTRKKEGKCRKYT